MLSLVKSKVWKLGIIALLMTFTLFSVAPKISSAHSDDNYTNLTNYAHQQGLNATFYDGKEKQVYIKLLEKNKVFKENSNHKKLDENNSKVVMISGNPETNGNVVIVEGTLKHNKNVMFYSFISQKTHELIALTTLSVDKSQNIEVKAIDPDGTVRIDKIYTYDQLNQITNNTIQNMQSYVNEQTSGAVHPMNFWVAIVCDFSGLLACGSGCLAFGPMAEACMVVCETAWATGICDNAP